MVDLLKKSIPTAVYGFSGNYGVEICRQTKDFISKEMQDKCKSEMWILVEDNLNKTGIGYIYKIKCICCGKEKQLDSLEGYTVLILKREGKIIPFNQVREYAQSFSERYSAKVGKDISINELKEKIKETFLK